MPTKPRSQQAIRSVKLTPKAMLGMHRARLRLEKLYDRRVPNSELIEVLALHYLNTTEEPEDIEPPPKPPKENWIEESELRPMHKAIRQDFCSVCKQQIWMQRSGVWFHNSPSVTAEPHDATPMV